MVQEDDYTFVTIDDDDMGISDAVVVDVTEEGGLSDAVMIDSPVTVDGEDFISIADDTVMLSDDDMVNGISIGMDGSDISFIL